MTASIGVSSIQKADTIAPSPKEPIKPFTLPSIMVKIVFIPKKHEVKYRKKFPEIFLSGAFFSELYKRDSLWRTCHSG